jgi:hypothetical protein
MRRYYITTTVLESIYLGAFTSFKISPCRCPNRYLGFIPCTCSKPPRIADLIWSGTRGLNYMPRAVLRTGYVDPSYGLRNVMRPLATSKAESKRRSRMQVAFGVLRPSPGVVRSGKVRDNPFQSSAVVTVSDDASVRNHCSAATANLERLGTGRRFAGPPAGASDRSSPYGAAHGPTPNLCLHDSSARRSMYLEEPRWAR